MALAGFLPPHERPEPWGAWKPRTTQPSELTPMTTVMSYHFPILSSSQSSLDMSQHPYNELNTMPEGQGASLNGRGHPAVPPGGAGDANLASRRSLSTPVNGSRQTTTPEKQLASGSQGEKKRTKLGYHRTAIACTHCRRRKIRCIGSPDAHNKCTNCIRLKKDCNFHPVDQQTAAEPRTKPPSRSSTGNKASSISSPAEMADGNGAVDDPGPQPYPSSTTFPESAAVSVTQSSSDEGFPRQSDDNTSAEPHPNRPFIAGTHAVADWIPGAVDTNGMLNQTDPNPSWRHYSMGTPLPSQYSGYSQPPSGPTAWTHGHPESVARGDVNWVDFHPSVRSASYSGDSVNNHHVPYLADTHGSADPRGSAGFQSIHPPPPPAVEGAPVTALTDPNALAANMMAHGGWHNAPATNHNAAIPHPNVSENYENWGYAGREGNQAARGGDHKIPSSGSGGHGQVYYS